MNDARRSNKMLWVFETKNSKLELKTQWRNYIEQTNRVLLAFEGDYSSFLNMKGELIQCQNEMIDVINKIIDTKRID